MAIVQTQFDFEEDLTSTNLNLLDTRIRDAIEELGMLKGVVSGIANGMWGVMPTGKEEMDSVWAYDTTKFRFIDYSAPSRQVEQTPQIVPAEKSNWNIGDYIYFGNDEIYDYISVDLNPVAASSAQVTWQYWSDDDLQWNTFTPIGTPASTLNFESNGTITWDNTLDTVGWERDVLDNIRNRPADSSKPVTDRGSRYWIRALVGADIAFKFDQISQLNQAISGVDDYLDLWVEWVGGFRVRINPGIALIDGTFVVIPSQETKFLSPPQTTGGVSWYASIQLTKEGLIEVVYGDSAASPTQPPTQHDAITLAHVLITGGATVLSQSDITDQRIFETTII